MVLSERLCAPYFYQNNTEDYMQSLSFETLLQRNKATEVFV